MKLLKRILSLMLAAVITAGGTAAFAENANPAPAEQTDPGDPAEEHEDKGMNPANTEYTQPDLSEYVLWDGKTEFLEDTNYYITETKGIGKDKTFTLPKTSRLLVTEGAQLLIYGGGALNVYGDMTIAPTAEFITSGTFSTAKESGFESFGKTSFTLSSTVNISSLFVARAGSKMTFSGTVNVYSDGDYISYGSTTLTGNSKTIVTGLWQIPESGMQISSGSFTITLSGRLDAAGYLSIAGEVRCSGMLELEASVKYFKSTASKLILTRSGRLLDYRRIYDGMAPGAYKAGMKGIDVSVWQGTIDWQRVKKSGVQFAIIRSSYGDDGLDKMFEYNITQARKAGISVGVYHYCYAKDTAEARIEAQHFLETIKPYKIDFPLMFDFEDESQRRLGRDKLTDIAEVFLKEIKDAGYLPMIYSYKNWLETNLDMERLSEYEVAVAEWGVPITTYGGDYGIWQYSCKGLVSGIDGDVDLDICVKDYAKIVREGGWNHLDEFD